jgi:hypothetical protein
MRRRHENALLAAAVATMAWALFGTATAGAVLTDRSAVRAAARHDAGVAGPLTVRRFRVKQVLR